MIQPAEKLRHIAPFYVMELLARTRRLEGEGRCLIHLEIGEPDFPTPAVALEAAHRAIADGNIHYTPALGLSALREAIAAGYGESNRVAAENVVITPGSSGALTLALAGLLDSDDEVLLPDPGYPCNRHLVILAGGRPVMLPVEEDSRFQLTAELIQRHWTDKTRAVMLASPANPSGGVIDPGELTSIVQTVGELGGAVIMDEIYHGLSYGGEVKSIAGVAEHVLVVNSFSKFYGMTGWRIGWLAAPRRLVPALERLAQNMFLAANTVGQHAAIAVLSDEARPELERRRQEFRQRRDYLLGELPRLGFGIPLLPEGAFYIYADCRGLTRDSAAFCEDMLQQASVVVTPGMDFGHHRNREYVRFAYTTSLENLREGVRRMEAWLKV